MENSGPVANAVVIKPEGDRGKILLTGIYPK